MLSASLNKSSLSLVLQFGVSPLECAIETIEKTNKKLSMAIDQHRQDPALRVDPLGMLLNGVVDPAVNGGISKYKVSCKRQFGALRSLQVRFRSVVNVSLVPCVHFRSDLGQS